MAGAEGNRIVGRNPVSALAAKMWAMNVAKSPEKVDLMLSEVDAMRGELAGPNPTPIEVILADRAAFCLLEVEALDLMAATPEGNRLVVDEHLGRRRSRAHDRLMSALRTLAQVRKLQQPGASQLK